MKQIFVAFLIVIVMASLLFASPSGVAYWTGKVEYVTTITGQRGVSCEYDYVGKKFWKTFVRSSCPSSIEVY